MRVAIVPAQITTVEDKVVGNLNLTQLALLSLPVCMFGFIYALLPPFLNVVVYKVVLLLMIMSLSSLLAVRLRGGLVLSYLQLLIIYVRRPRYFVYLKSDVYLRAVNEKLVEGIADVAKEALPEQPVAYMPTYEEQYEFERLIEMSQTRFNVKPTKKGSLHVTITKI